MRFSFPCGSEGFRGSCIDTEDFLFRPSFFFSSVPPQEAASLALTAPVVESEKLSDLKSDESMLSSVFALVVDPAASWGKYSLFDESLGLATTVFGEMPWEGLRSACGVAMWVCLGCVWRNLGNGICCLEAPC